jgi:hypothetical protein
MNAADDLFPDSARVIYGKAPLTGVVCQLRFPPILRIESAPPADFQDRIREQFPLLERRPQSPTPPGIPRSPCAKPLKNCQTTRSVACVF